MSKKNEEILKGNSELFYRSSSVAIEGFDEEKREVLLSFASETDEVERWYGTEILDHSNVNMKRLRDVGSFLYNHSGEIIGPIKKAWVEEGVSRAVVGFDETDDGEKRMIQVKNKSLRGVSNGYRVKTLKELQPGEEYKLATKTVKGRKDKNIYIVKDWEPAEISATPIPADASVGIGRSLTRSLDGIKILKGGNEMGNDGMADGLMDQLRSFVKEELRTVSDNLKASLLEEIKSKKEDPKKQERSQEQNIVKVSVESFKDLSNRAGAISSEVGNQVTNLILEGKTEAEVLRFINDEMVKGAGTQMNVKGGDGTGRNEQKKKDDTDNGPVRSFENVEDEEFYSAITNTCMFSS